MEIKAKYNIGDIVWTMNTRFMAKQGKVIEVNTKSLPIKYTLVFSERPYHKDKDYARNINQNNIYPYIKDLEDDIKFRPVAMIYASQEIIDYYDGKLSKMEYDKYIDNLEY